MSHTLNNSTIQATTNPYMAPRTPALLNEACAAAMDAAKRNKVLKLASSIKSANMTAVAFGIGLALMFLGSFSPFATTASGWIFTFSISSFMLAGLMFFVSYFSIACRLNGMPFGICIFCASFLVPFVPIALYLFHYYQAKKITSSAGIKFGFVGPVKKTLERFRDSTQPKLDYGFPVELDGRILESAEWTEEYADVVEAEAV